MTDSAPDRDEENQAAETHTTWEEVGRELLQSELVDRRIELGHAFSDAEKTVRNGEDLTPEHIHTIRVALNRAQERVENELAPVAGVEAWSSPPPRIPKGVLQELLSHPKEESLDLCEDLDEQEQGDE